MLKRLDLRGVSDLPSRMPRRESAPKEPIDAVRTILADVRERGDEALRELTERFDGVRLDQLRVPPDIIEQALESVPEKVISALRDAADAIREFHQAGVGNPHSYRRDGIQIDALTVPVDRAGLYVPGGRGAYPSSVLMTAIPARVAGVREIALCVPPDRSTGQVSMVTLAAASISEVDEVYAVGGAQAIGAMAYGTETIRPVDVIAGPGNLYVAIAKREVAGVVGVPSAFAGPSEIVVVADETTPVDFAAVDLMVQAEHGPNGQAWLITWSAEVADRIDDALAELVARAPRRSDIEATLLNGGWCVVVDGPNEAVQVSNLVAPEHLQLMNADPRALLSGVRHAGAVFCGVLAPASIGDYVAGPSHVLPTDRTARFAGALGVGDFVKPIHVVSISRRGFDSVAPVVETLATAEGFDAHAESISLRLRRLASNVGEFELELES